MFGIKIISETPAFRKCNKNVACQGTFKENLTCSVDSYSDGLEIAVYDRQFTFLSFKVIKMIKGPLTRKIFIICSESWCFNNYFDTNCSWKNV